MGISPFDLFYLTSRSLAANMVRSSLTLLGVFMGVSAVGTTLNIADIADSMIEEQLAQRDKPFVTPYLFSDDGSFDNNDLNQADQQYLKRSVPQIRSISFVNTVNYSATLQYLASEVKEVQIFGVSKNYIETTGRRMISGRFFSPADYAQYRAVAIIDQKLSTALFRKESPLNQAIFSDSQRLIVVGVVESKSGGELGRGGGSLWVPDTYASSLASEFTFSNLQISAFNIEDVPALTENIKQALSRRYPKATVETFDNTSDLLAQRQIQRLAANALAIVGLVALAIGGVGIANITIAAVLERTQEIGIRRAIGATRLEIMMQFILEAVILSILGGALAIGTVHCATQFVTSALFPAPYRFSHRNAALAMGAAITVGVGSSFLPALRATRVDIIAALRN
ncbi:ABC transporter permease [Alkalinema sp. FACHB-956]|uniref:ABC transporter permease n=1 Tax=Alkalinema sp. FACHB-956 TaxID=2692768 RepID=UPI0016828072|nr:ABC transporter permease [Alkalinema sp. FACHB-956]MBD2330148.1 ABC transporter permease [Alkalinema sp. FACHB-956]